MFSIRDMTIHAKAVAGVVKSTIADALSPVEKRLDAIESLPKAGQIKSDILAEVEGLIPKVKDGEPCASVTLEDVAPMVDQAVKSAIPDLSNFIHVDQVEKMVSDAVSRALESIEMPKNGENGRDALDIEILPAIDESKNYPRGTYASHNGGLWKSYQMTVGMKGWECIVDGVAEVEVKHDESDPRVIFLGIKKSSGALSHEHITIPAVIDKGIYNPESLYEKGDGVTWAGSYWIANDEPDHKPGTGDGWRLAVKKGRDGKDGINGIDKAPRVAK